MVFAVAARLAAISLIGSTVSKAARADSRAYPGRDHRGHQRHKVSTPTRWPPRPFPRRSSTPLPRWRARPGGPRLGFHRRAGGARAPCVGLTPRLVEYGRDVSHVVA